MVTVSIPLDLKFALSPTLATMNSTKAFGSAAVSTAVHIFGSLTCATCWTIFGPALALLFGSAGTAFLSTLRPYAPIALAISACGLAYSVYQLRASRGHSSKLPYRMAGLLTMLSIAGWFGSSVYTLVTFVKG